MLGAIIGDIAGSRFEFCNAKTTKFTTIGPGCNYTDDTICTVAVADIILNDRYIREGLLDWCSRYPRPMGGYGANFSLWLNAGGINPNYSFGNGAAMRISPAGWLFDDVRDVLTKSAALTECSHNHPQGIIGAQTVAAIIWMLRKEKDLSLAERYVKGVYGSVPKYRPFSNSFDESCMNAVPVAVSCLLASSSFEDAVRKAIIVGGDSDTIGAITGGMAEAFYGIDAVLASKAIALLPDDMCEIIAQFYDTAPIGKRQKNAVKRAFKLAGR